MNVVFFEEENRMTKRLKSTSNLSTRNVPFSVELNANPFFGFHSLVHPRDSCLNKEDLSPKKFEEMRSPCHTDREKSKDETKRKSKPLSRDKTCKRDLQQSEG